MNKNYHEKLWVDNGLIIDFMCLFLIELTSLLHVDKTGLFIV